VGPTGAKKNDITLLHLIGSAAFKVVDGDLMVGVNEREIDGDRLADDLIQIDLGRGDPVLEDVQRRINVSTPGETLVESRDLPEARPAPMWRDLNFDVRGRWAQGVRVHAH